MSYYTMYQLCQILLVCGQAHTHHGIWRSETVRTLHVVERIGRFMASKRHGHVAAASHKVQPTSLPMTHIGFGAREGSLSAGRQCLFGRRCTRALESQRHRSPFVLFISHRAPTTLFHPFPMDSIKQLECEGRRSPRRRAVKRRSWWGNPSIPIRYGSGGWQ